MQVEQEPEPSIPERHVVAIAAAVAALFGPDAAVRSIEPAGAWARHGRVRLQGSHDMSRQRGARSL